MNNLLKISGLASLALVLQTSAFSQDDVNKEKDTDKKSAYDEIIIRHKSDKDAKVTIEIKDGDVLIDGKPISDFDDSTLSIHKRKFKVLDGRKFSFNGEINGDGDMLVAPYRNHSGTLGYGDIRKPQAYLGVSSEKPADSQGARILNVTDGSAAEVAGLQSGDIITKVDETAITDPQSLSAAIRKHKTGDKVTITFSRDGKVQKQAATLGTMTEHMNFDFEMPDLKVMPELKQLLDLKQFDMGDMAPQVFGQDFNRPLKLGIKAQDTEDGKGAKVLDVDDESTAAKAGIKEGDIITRFDGKEINSALALAAAARAARDKVSVHVSILRGGKAQDIEVKVPKKLRTADL
jgi:serine protease Do